MKPCSTSLLKIPLNLNKEICKQVLPAGEQNLPPVSDLSVAHLKVQMYMEPELLGVCLLSIIRRLWAHHQFLPLNRKHQNMSEMPSGSDLTWSQSCCWRDHAALHRLCTYLMTDRRTASVFNACLQCLHHIWQWISDSDSSSQLVPYGFGSVRVRRELSRCRCTDSQNAECMKFCSVQEKPR